MIPSGKKVIIKPATTYIFELGHVDQTWKLLKNAITEIFNRNHGGLSFEELYRSGKKKKKKRLSSATSHRA